MDAPNEKTQAEPGPLLDGSLRRTLACVGVVGACLLVAAGAIFGGRTAVGVAAGSVTAIANLFAFAFLARALLGSKAGGAYAVLALLKIGVLFGGLFWLFRAGWVAPLPFVAGYGSLPVGISIAPLFGTSSRGGSNEG